MEFSDSGAAHTAFSWPVQMALLSARLSVTAQRLTKKNSLAVKEQIGDAGVVDSVPVADSLHKLEQVCTHSAQRFLHLPFSCNVQSGCKLVCGKTFS